MKHSARPLFEGKFKVKAVMIDLDGTLINTAPEITWAVNAMLDALNLSPLPLSKVQNFIGEGATKLVERCLIEVIQAKPDLALFNQAVDFFFTNYAEVVIKSLPYPQVKLALQHLKNAGMPLACITNKPARFSEPLLEISGLIDFFDIVISGDTLAKKKPDPDQIFHICQHFGIEPWEALLIGDSNTDILAAKNAGSYIFTVPYGYNQGLPIDHTKVDAAVDDLEDALSYLDI
jgi:phosphoglycolate phosphatase